MKPGEVVEPVVDAAKHPLRTAAWSFGVARGLAATVIRVASGQRGPVVPGHVPGPEAEAAEENVEHEEVAQDDLIDAPETERVSTIGVVSDVPPAPQREPEPLGEAFVNEPSAVSRASAHGGGGRDAEIDDWYGELAEDEPEGGGFVLEALAAGDTDEAVQTGDLKAILSESETLRKAAELDKS